MLYEFHRKQNAKKPGTVHSTYLITGTRRVESAPYTNGVHSQDDGEDTAMQSSPPLPSSSFPKPDETPGEVVRTRSVMLVKEENLDDAKNLFESISSMHIYSLEANGLSDVQALAECNRKVAVSYASEDPLLEWKQYGTIQNPNARRRPRRTAPPTPAPVAKDAGLNAKPLAATAKVKEETKTEPKQSSAKATPEPGKKDISKPAQTKRQNSDIFKSFAKAKTAPKQDSQSSAEASPAAEPSDEPMTGFSEDEADDDALLEAEEAAKEPTGKNKTEREAELQAMMDQEDEPMDDPSPAAGEQSEELEATVDKAESQKDGEPKENVTVENGRRRGRRRVTKKKTVKDEEGYLGELHPFYRCMILTDNSQ